MSVKTNNPIDNNESYTKKDFPAIYDELLTLVNNLTDRWNPSNEADPGVVLIKLMSVLGDKLNYNIDKQTLELLPGSVTQRKNAQQIFNLIGYKMKWYQSATTKVGFKVDSDTIKEDIFIPKYTEITDNEGSIIYTILDNVRIYKDDVDAKTFSTIEVDAIEGTLSTIENVTDSDLDENFRFTLPTLSVAQNGIFITDSIGSWKMVDNVAAYPTDNRVFELQINDTETKAYIKFPTKLTTEDTANTSLTIKYISSNGVDGNILRDTLSKFLDADGNSIPSEDIKIYQLQSTDNGKDPETIETAYKNSRYTVGTFDTLITKDDYYKYIRQLYVDGKVDVSNLIVTDRSDDINCCFDVITKSNNVNITKHYSGTMTPYQLCLYMLKTSNDFKTRFNAITDSVVKLNVEALLKEAKCISLDIILPADTSADGNEKYFYKAYFDVTGQIVTTEKLTQAEATALEENVRINLKSIYSPENLNFGESIDYLQLVDNIKKTDLRIKEVIINTPTYVVVPYSGKTNYSSADAFGTSLNDTSLELVAKSIASGRASIYDFDTRFKLSLNTKTATLSNITNVNSKLKMFVAAGHDYTLDKNEYVILSTPQYTNTNQYNGNVKVKCKSTNNGSFEITNTNGGEMFYYTLGDGETVEFYYKDSSTNQYRTDTYGEGTVVAFTVIGANGSTINSAPASIGNSNTVYIWKENSYEFTDRQISDGLYYTSNFSTTLTTGQSYTLGSSDIFTYYNKDDSGYPQTIIALGQGTVIEATSNLTITKSTVEKKLLTSFKVINQDIVVLNQGCNIAVTSDSTSSLSLSNNNDYRQTLTSTKLSITDKDGTTTNYQNNVAGTPYTISSRLDLVYTGEPIAIKNSNGSTNNSNPVAHCITIEHFNTTSSGAVNNTKYKETEEFEADPSDSTLNAINELERFRTYAADTDGTYYKHSTSLSTTAEYITFSENILISSQSDSGQDVCRLLSENKVDCLYGNHVNPVKSASGAECNTTTNEITLSAANAYVQISAETLDSLDDSDIRLVPITVSCSDITASVTVTQQNSSNTVVGDSYVKSFASHNSLNFAVRLHKSCAKLVFTATSLASGSTIFITIGDQVYRTKPRTVGSVTTSLSKSLGIDKFIANDTESQIISKIAELESAVDDSFDYTYQVNKQDTCDNLLSPDSFFDSNHLYNKFVICQYDYDGAVTGKTDGVTVNKYSIKV